MKLHTFIPSVTTCAILALAATTHAAALVASYGFNNTLAANEPGVPALVATDPTSGASFSTDTVFSVPNTPIYNFTGIADPTNEQGGLSLDTTSLVSPTSYSAELVFKFTAGANAWRRILDVQSRASDNGFYVDPTNNLDLYPTAGSSSLFTTDVYHHVVLTVDSGNVNAYLDGVFQFTTVSTLMDISNPDNPSLTLNLFLDNLGGAGQHEYSPGSISLFRLYNGPLTSDEAAALPTAIPEPTSLALLTLSLPLLSRRR